MTTAHTPGPYSVHTYSEIQTRKTIAREDGSTFESAAITIGAGRKILGEVRYASVPVGFPWIDSEEEMRAVAALWIAAPELLEVAETAVSALAELIEHCGDDMLDSRSKRIDEINAIIAKATGATS